ncbi:PIN domain-containing protein [Massilia aquatica]|uniref:PIN domain-containing protein n=1 Tax=Massilia aquatica TaxID=2609000 RepID=A0ABX0ME15_9BURK|nr:hypothetical protein [Massilia aquatica]NHZ44619.1 hypothetical protein [Massilia aquatica]
MATTPKPKAVPKKSKPAKKGCPAKRGKAKKVASAASVGGAGGAFENRVQAVKLLGLVLGTATPGVPESSRILRLQFQARVHGPHTDDLVCTVEGGNGLTSRVLMQMKRGLTPRKSDKAFEEAIGNAWLDFKSVDFVWLADRLVIVHDASSFHDMRGAHDVVRYAQLSTLASEWIEKLTAAGAGSVLKRNALAAIRESVDVYSDATVSDDELFQFARHVDFCNHDLDVEGTAEHLNYINLIRLAATQCGVSFDANHVWARLVSACTMLNATYGAVDFSNLALVIGGDLAIWFDAYRSQAGQTSLRFTAMSAMPASTGATHASTTAWAGIVGGASIANTGADQPSNARSASVDKLISGQLDHINTFIKACKYVEAASSLQQIGQNLGALDNHQRARWYHMRGICRWHHDDDDERAADDFIKAAGLCDDDDKLAAARVRGFLLRRDIPAALTAGAEALERFPESLAVWAAVTNARLANKETVAVADIPREHLLQADAFQLVSFGMHARGLVGEARALGMEALKLGTSNFFTRNSTLSFLLEDIASNSLNLSFRMLEVKDKEDLRFVLATFEPRHQNLWSIEAPAILSDTLYRLAFGHLILGNFGEALAVVSEARIRGIDNSNIGRVEMEALAQLGRRDEALEVGQKVLESMSPGGLVAFGQIANFAQNVPAIERAIEVAGRLHSSEQSVTDALISLRWEALSRTDFTELAMTEVGALDANSMTSISMLTTAARLLHKNHQEARAVVFSTRAEKLALVSTEPGEKYMVASLLSYMKLLKNAAALYEMILPAGQFSELHGELLYCYVRSGARAKALGLIRSFPEGWQDDDVARRLAIELGHAAGDWSLLSGVVDAQLRAEPTKAMSWLFKLMVEMRISQAHMTQAISTLPPLLQGSIHDLAQLGSVELANGFKDEGMLRLYRMRRNNLNSAESAAAYISTHMLEANNLPLLNREFDTVEAGTTVTIVGSDGVVSTFTLDPDECNELPETEEFRLSTSPALKQLLGKRTGDQFVVEDVFGGRKTYTVASVGSAYRRLLELAKVSLNVSLEPSKNLRSITLDEDKDGVLQFDKLTDQLNKTAEAANGVLGLYESHHFTLGVTARMLGRDIVTLVRSWPAQKLALVVGEGSGEMRDIALELLRRSDASFVVDAATLTELAQIGSLSALALLPKVLVSTRTLDVLKGRLLRAESDHSSGIAGTENGRLVFHEITAKNHKQEIAFLTEFCESVERYCTVVPAYGLTTPPLQLSEVEFVVSDEEYAVLLVALEHQSTLLALDQRFRMMAEYCGLTGVWPQVFLMEQLSKGQMTQRDYSRASLQMFFRNRNFVSLRAQDLQVLVYQGGDWLDAGIRRFVKHIAQDTTDFNSAAYVTLDFLRLIIRSGGCQFGVVLELLERLVEGLLRHKSCPDHFSERVLNFLRQPINSGEWHVDTQSYFRLAVNAAKSAARREITDAPIQARVLFCTSPPFLLNGLTSPFYFQNDETSKRKDPDTVSSPGDYAIVGNVDIPPLTPQDMSTG